MKSLLYPLLVFASFVIATFLMFQNLETVFADKLNTLVLYAYCGSIGYDQNNFMLTLGCSVLLGICFWVFGKKLTKPANA